MSRMPAGILREAVIDTAAITANVRQLRRLTARDGIDDALAHRMVEAQATRAQRLAIADDVIVNTGTRGDLAGPVRELDGRYRQLAALRAPAG